MQQPNLIIVLADQLRRDALGCAGDGNVHTPNIDHLAASGVRFSTACSTFPACVPFRFSLLTGEYAHSRNVPALGYRLSPAERTLGEEIGAAGYQTAYIGKWHLYSAYGVSGGLSLSQACRTPVPASHRRGWDYWRGFELRNDYFDTWYFADDDPEPRRLAGYQTDGLFDLASRYLEHDREVGQPFLLVLSLEAPHPPFVAPPAALERVRQRGPLALRANVDAGAIRFFPPEWYDAHGPGGAVDPADPASVARVFDANLRAYYAMIEVIDDHIGQLGRLLERTGLAADTIVMLLADHGELGGSHGMLGKAEPWEESIGIPLIVSNPGGDRIPAGRICATPLGTEDLFATCIGLTGAGSDPAPPRADFAPYLSGPAVAPERPGVLLEFVTETRPDRAYYTETWRGIRTAKHKYTVLGSRSGAHPWQLFDLGADPFEQRNRIADPAAAELAGELHAALIELLDASADDYALASAFGHGARCVVA